MKVRELLQIELWSKGTSRKLLVGFGIASGLALVGFFAWYEVEVRWMTSGEREAARVAFRSAEDLDNMDALSDVELDARMTQLDAGLKAADAAAKTIRDQKVAKRLAAYVIGVEFEREKGSDRWLLKSDDLSRKTEALLDQLKEEHRKALHRALD